VVLPQADTTKASATILDKGRIIDFEKIIACLSVPKSQMEVNYNPA
jgi:hypothetical protein